MLDDSRGVPGLEYGVLVQILTIWSLKPELELCSHSWHHLTVWAVFAAACQATMIPVSTFNIEAMVLC